KCDPITTSRCADQSIDGSKYVSCRLEFQRPDGGGLKKVALAKILCEHMHDRLMHVFDHAIILRRDVQANVSKLRSVAPAKSSERYRRELHLTRLPERMHNVGRCTG